MSNLWRSLRLVLQHRLMFSIATFCAVMVAVLWGANIGTIYPLIEVVIKAQGPGEWAQVKIQEASSKAAEARATIAIEQARALPAAERAMAQTLLHEGREAVAAIPEVPPLVREQLALRLNEALDFGDPANPVELERAQSRLEAEQQELRNSRWIQQRVVPWLPDDAFKTVGLVIGLLILGTIIKGLFLIANGILTSSIVGLAMHELRNQLYRRTLRMDQASFSSDGTSDLMSRFTFDMENLSAGLKLVCTSAMLEPLKMLSCMIGAAFVSWRLLLFSMLVAPIGLYLIHRLSLTLKQANRRAMEGMSRIYGLLEETFQGIAVVKAFTMERYEHRRFHEENKAYFRKTMRIARYDSLTNPLTEWMGLCMISMTLLGGLYLVVNKETHLFGIRMSDRPPSIGALLVFYGLLAGTSDPARRLSSIINRLQRAAAAADRIYALLDREPEVEDCPQPVRLTRHRRSLVFRNVGFGYRPGISVLEGIDLEIPFGQAVALVGPNGCGKSSLVNLIPRFYDPWDGEILLDGVNLREMRLRDLRGQIGLVTQEPILFNDTVLSNIRYGRPDATDQAVFAAAKQAHAHRFIQEKLPQGYETVIGERGSTLSGGQRQRIALARVILRDPALLILDEATSQIDVESEQLIHRVLQEFIQNRTTLIITHRMSTLSLVDQIVVMDHGRILDRGSSPALAKRCPFFQRLFREAA